MINEHLLCFIYFKPQELEYKINHTEWLKFWFFGIKADTEKC